MAKKTLLSSAISLAIAGTITLAWNVNAGNHSFSFDPITSSANSADWDATAPWKIPEDYKQTVVSDESSLNIYDGGRDDWPDMNTVNETGKMSGRFMYRTHELRSPNNQPEGGSVSVVDLKTGKTKLLAQDPDWNALDGIRWTP